MIEIKKNSLGCIVVKGAWRRELDLFVLTLKNISDRISEDFFFSFFVFMYMMYVLDKQYSK